MTQNDNEIDDLSQNTASQSSDCNVGNDGKNKLPEPPPSWQSPHAPMEQSHSGESDSTNTSVRFENEQMGSINSNVQMYDLAEEYRNLRKKISIARVLAIVSLFIGGVLLSTVSLIFAYLAWRALADLAQSNRVNEATYVLAKRAIIVTVGMGAIALAANAVTVVMLYPMIMHMMQTGDVSQVLPWMQPGAPSGGAGSGYETWG